MRYLLTGGAGFIGSHLAEALLEAGSSVTILDDLSTGRMENVAHLLDGERAVFVEGSVLNAPLVDELVRDTNACLHLASVVGVQLVLASPLASLQQNVRGLDVVISAAAQHGRRLLFTSTSEVYGKADGLLLHEDDDRILGSTFKSRWGYAIAKSYGEALIHAHYLERGLPATVVRLFNTVGPRQTGRYGMVLPRLVGQAVAGNDLTIYGTGAQTRCFTHIAGAVRAIMMLLDRPEAFGQVFNVGSSTEVSILDLGRRILGKTGSRSRMVLVPYADAYGSEFEELGRRRPDTAALARLTGWCPLKTIDDAIDDVIDYARERPWAITAPFDDDGLALTGG